MVYNSTYILGPSALNHFEHIHREIYIIGITFFFLFVTPMSDKSYKVIF